MRPILLQRAQATVRSELHRLCDAFMAPPAAGKRRRKTQETQERPLLDYAVAALKLSEVLLATSLHAGEALRRGWCLPQLEPAAQYTAEAPPVHLQLQRMTPYWLTGGTLRGRRCANALCPVPCATYPAPNAQCR